MKLLGSQVKNSAFIWMKYPNVICIVYAVPVLWLSSLWLSSSSMKTLLLFFSSFIFLQVFRESSESFVITVYRAAPSPSNRSLCTAHPSITVFPWIGSISPTLSGICEVLFVTLCQISKLLCCLCSVHDIWTSAAYVFFLMSFPIVFLLNHSAPPSLLKFFPGPP